MNQRRRIGRGPVSREALNRTNVRDKRYTYQQFQADRERAYLRSLTRIGPNYWEPEDEWQGD